MKLSTENIKDFLSKKLNVTDELKRISKKKNDHKENVRTFEVQGSRKETKHPASSRVLKSGGGFTVTEERDSYIEVESVEYEVTTNPEDTKIISVVKIDDNKDEDEVLFTDSKYFNDRSKKHLSNAKDFIFIIADKLQEEYSAPIVGISTLNAFKKDKGVVYSYLEESIGSKKERELLNILDVIEKNTKISLSAMAEPALFECSLDEEESERIVSDLTKKRIYDALIEMGFKYSPELAKASNKVCEGDWDILSWIVNPNFK